KPTPASHALEPTAANGKTARVVNAFVARAAEVLKGESPANGMLARGLSERPRFAGYRERFKLRAAAIAAYPMYRGVASLAGMDVFVPAGEGDSWAFSVAGRAWAAPNYSLRSS